MWNAFKVNNKNTPFHTFFFSVSVVEFEQVNVSCENMWINSKLTQSNGKGIWLFICCKTKLKKKLFFFKYAFYKIYIICRKKNLYGKKSFILKKLFTEKKNSFSEKNISENVKNYISNLRNIFLCRKCFCYK